MLKKTFIFLKNVAFTKWKVNSLLTFVQGKISHKTKYNTKKQNEVCYVFAERENELHFHETL